jgi:GntR family transcriptional repressor for pyruvate dehydrogenase complex
MRPDAEFVPVQRRRLSDELAERILASIAAGRLRPGDQLPPIVEMARSFHVAAATVREALIRLESQRVVEIRHGAGVFVTAVAA